MGRILALPINTLTSRGGIPRQYRWGLDTTDNGKGLKLRRYTDNGRHKRRAQWRKASSANAKNILHACAVG